MKVNPDLNGFSISAKGLSIQRKKMNLIAENIASADTVRDEAGNPYKKKFLSVIENAQQSSVSLTNSSISIKRSNNSHIPAINDLKSIEGFSNIKISEEVAAGQGEVVHMPEHPFADEKGYVEMSNVNIINEMTDMIAASRSYEANLTAFNSTKQMIKDSLDI